MTVAVSNVSATNTFGYWKDRTNELAHAMSTVVVSAGSNTAGNTGVTGTFYANVISVGNSTVNVVISGANSTLKTKGNYFLNANNSWVAFPVFYTTINTEGTLSQLVDSYLLADYNTADYTINVKNTAGSGYHAEKILLTQDSGTVYVSEYSIINTAAIVDQFSANANTTHVRLYINPLVTNTAITFTRIGA